MYSAKMQEGKQMNLVRHPGHCCNRALCDTSGFTLVELMVVVAIVGILAAIAYPFYGQYVLRSHRTDGKNAVMDLASREERFFSVNNAYTNNAAALGYGASATFPMSVGATSQSYYSLTVAFTTAPAGYTAIATPIAPQTSDTTCYSYQIDQSGLQSNLNVSGNSLPTTGCW